MGLNYFIDTRAAGFCGLQIQKSQQPNQQPSQQPVNLSTVTSFKHTLVLDENVIYSQLFDFTEGNNLLLSASAPLFALSIRVITTKNFADFDKKILASCLYQEVKVFTNKLKEANCPKNIISRASYVVCAFVDDVILNSSFGKENNWQEMSLVNFFHEDKSENEYFFTLLDEAYQDPAIYADLLELIYFCLKLGFMGKYRQLPDGLNSLTTITNLLYTEILKQRPEISRSLFVSARVAQQIPEVKPVIEKRIHLPLIIILSIVISLSAVGAVYTIFKNNFLEHNLSQENV